MSIRIGPTGRRPPFKFAAQARVGFSDTDAQGIVYYGRYMPFFDLARVEYLRHLDLLASGAGMGQFVMRANTVEYFAPARFDDLVEIHVRVARIGSTSATWECHAYRDEDDLLLVTAQQTVVYVDLEQHRAHPIPQPFRERVHAFEGGDVKLAAPA